MYKFFLLTAFPLLMLFSCSDLEQAGAQLTSEIDKNAPRAEQAAARGKAAEEKGKITDAARLYDELSLKYPIYPEAPELNYKAALLWEEASKPKKAFDSYQNYITLYRNGKNYQSALNRQSEIAFSAAKGGLSKKFLGLKQDLQYEDVVDMLSKVRDNAPASDLAARAQFALGTYSESKGKTTEAVAAFFKVADDFPEHSLAPEANLRAGKALSGVTAGNYNSSNLDRARQTLEDLIQQYPGSTQATEAQTLLGELTGTDLSRIYDVANFYEKSGKIPSAKLYYEEVLEKAAPGSEYYVKAQERLNAL